MKYIVKIFLDGIHWDNSYTDDKNEAEQWKTEFEDKEVSIYDRINQDALEEFIDEFHIINAEAIEVTVEIEG